MHLISPFKYTDMACNGEAIWIKEKFLIGRRATIFILITEGALSGAEQKKRQGTGLC